MNDTRKSRLGLRQEIELAASFIAGKVSMPRWMLRCPVCSHGFPHSDISMSNTTFDAFAWLGDQPELPVGGLSVACPNCKSISVYQRHQLTYEA